MAHFAQQITGGLKDLASLLERQEKQERDEIEARKRDKAFEQDARITDLKLKMAEDEFTRRTDPENKAAEKLAREQRELEGTFRFQEIERRHELALEADARFEREKDIPFDQLSDDSKAFREDYLDRNIIDNFESDTLDFERNKLQREREEFSRIQADSEAFDREFGGGDITIPSIPESPTLPPRPTLPEPLAREPSPLEPTPEIQEDAFAPFGGGPDEGLQEFIAPSLEIPTGPREPTVIPFEDTRAGIQEQIREAVRRGARLGKSEEDVLALPDMIDLENKLAISLDQEQGIIQNGRWERNRIVSSLDQLPEDQREHAFEIIDEGTNERVIYIETVQEEKRRQDSEDREIEKQDKKLVRFERMIANGVDPGLAATLSQVGVDDPIVSAVTEAVAREKSLSLEQSLQVEANVAAGNTQVISDPVVAGDLKEKGFEVEEQLDPATGEKAFIVNAPGSTERAEELIKEGLNKIVTGAKDPETGKIVIQSKTGNIKSASESFLPLTFDVEITDPREGKIFKSITKDVRPVGVRDFEIGGSMEKIMADILRESTVDGSPPPLALDVVAQLMDAIGDVPIKVRSLQKGGGDIPTAGVETEQMRELAVSELRKRLNAKALELGFRTGNERPGEVRTPGQEPFGSEARERILKGFEGLRQLTEENEPFFEALGR